VLPIVLLAARPLAAQVSIAPATVAPATFERFALRVANPDSSPVTAVRLEVPAVLTVLGVDVPAGWTWHLTPATDTSATTIVWVGGSLPQGEFREFAVLARLAADARQLTLVFPARLDHADGRAVAFTRGGDAPPPAMTIRGTTDVSARGAVALGGGALGVAVLALALALHRRRG